MSIQTSADTQPSARARLLSGIVTQSTEPKPCPEPVNAIIDPEAHRCALDDLEFYVVTALEAVYDMTVS
jgi:hypothetical protein